MSIISNNNIGLNSKAWLNRYVENWIKSHFNNPHLDKTAYTKHQHKLTFYCKEINIDDIQDLVDELQKVYKDPTIQWRKSYPNYYLIGGDCFANFEEHHTPIKLIYNSWLTVMHVVLENVE